ncbi:MAG: sensor histidine kinase [Deltaproteobacteria bacterium]|nr:sensor histidine kinase [Deltaproteobacteria bacterium]
MKEKRFNPVTTAALALLLMLLLFSLDLFYCGRVMRYCDMVSGQLHLVHRLVVLESGGKTEAVAESAAGTVARGAPVIPAELDILSRGGVFAGEELPALVQPELEFLVKSLVSLTWARANTEVGNESYLSLTTVYQEKLKRLLQALVFREKNARARGRQLYQGLLWVFAAVWIVAGVLLLGLRRQRRRWRRREALLEFILGVLQNQPYPFFILDEKLDFRLLSGAGKRLLGFDPRADLTASFTRFVRDQKLIEDLNQQLGQPWTDEHRVWQPLFAGPRPLELLNEELSEPLELSWSVFVLGKSRYFFALGVSVGKNEIRLPAMKNQAPASADAASRFKEFSSELFRVQDNERRLLADELHDGLCQSLAALKMQVSGIERRLDNEEVAEECRQVRRFIAQIIEDVRRLSHDLSPVVLEDLGLGDALAHLVNNFARLNGLKASIAISDIDDLFSPEAARNIYRIVQESLNNIAKHAKASLVVLEVEKKGSGLQLSLRDDGVGFVVEEATGKRSGAGLGLASMQQRAQLLDGELEIRSRPGKGTEIRLRLAGGRSRCADEKPL